MEFFINLYDQISKDSFLTALSVGGLITWIFYRIGKADERNTVLESFAKEIGIHSQWMSNQYPDHVFTDSNWRNLNYIVFKLSTVAIDNAISKGPSLFLNKDLVTELVIYRQLVNNFNQIIESAQQFQSGSDLWKNKKPPKKLADRMAELTGLIHWYGIGNSMQSSSAHNAFDRINHNLQDERNTRIIGMIWFITSINLFRFKRFIVNYL